MSKVSSHLPNKNESVKVLPSVHDTDLDNPTSVKSPKIVPKTTIYQDIDYLKSDKPFVIARFIFECGHKLNAKVLTVSTALQFLHRFNKATENSASYDRYLISAACLYLAGKVEDNDHLRLRDIINVVYTTLHRERYFINAFRIVVVFLIHILSYNIGFELCR